MISRFFTLLTGLMLSFYAQSLSAQGFATQIDSAEVESGQLVCVPLRALGFADIVSFQYALHWDTEVLQFDHIQNVNMPAEFDEEAYNLYAPNTLLVGWADIWGVGQSRADHSILYEVCFQAIGPVGSSTAVICDGEGFAPATGEAEAYNSNFQNVWNGDLNTPGLIEITAASGILSSKNPGAGEMTAFQISPNPTSSASSLNISAVAPASGVLTVRDAAGRQVLEQKINLRTGENSFELPAKVLRVKGMYHVSVQTETGTQTEWLSVL